MNSIDRLKAATRIADEVASRIVSTDSTPDMIEARRDQLQEMSHDEFVDHILTLEKVKNQGGAKVEDVAQALLATPELAIFTYDQLASTIRKHMPDAKTTGKGVASYVTKHKDEWNIVKREKFALDPADIMAAVGGE